MLAKHVQSMLMMAAGMYLQQARYYQLGSPCFTDMYVNHVIMDDAIKFMEVIIWTWSCSNILCIKIIQLIAYGTNNILIGKTLMNFMNQYNHIIYHICKIYITMYVCLYPQSLDHSSIYQNFYHQLLALWFISNTCVARTLLMYKAVTYYSLHSYDTNLMNIQEVYIC